MKDQISICDCGNPLIWTFMVPRNEWFCWVCKSSYPMMNVEQVDETEKLADKLKADKKEFDVLYKHYASPNSYRGQCKKCDKRDSYHADHLTKLQMEKHLNAKKLIFGGA